MDAKKLIVALVALLLIVGAAFYGAYLFLSATSDTPTKDLPIPTGTGTNVGQQPTGSNTIGTAPIATSTNGIEEDLGPKDSSDIEKEYANLFTKISAQKITFVPTTGSSTKAASVYALYSEDIAFEKSLFPQRKDFSIDIAFLDLNGDGVEEALVYENLSSMCGSSGCPFDVYIKEGKEWKSVLQTVTSENIALLSQAGGGYRNLFVAAHGEVGYETEIMRWVWSGSLYQPLGVEARWNGSTFIIES